MNTKIVWIGVIVVIVLGGLWFVMKDNSGGDDVMMTEKDGAMVEEDDATEAEDGTVMKGGGTYEIYNEAKLAKANDGKVVLFFRASWCPTCKALDADIKKNIKNVPADVTILDVDYDKYSDLKQKYGVTTQHTLVQVDAQGNEIAKWVGSESLSDLTTQIK